MAAIDKSYITLDNLDCHYAKQNGVDLEARVTAQSNWSISNSIITGAYRKGIYAAGTSSNRITAVVINGNSITDFGGSTGTGSETMPNGIAILYVDAFSIYSNTISIPNLTNGGNGGHILIKWGSTSNLSSSIHDNTLTGTFQVGSPVSAAIAIDKGNHVSIYRNTITSDTKIIIWFDESNTDANDGPSHCEVYDNDFAPGAGTKIGLMIERSQNNNIHHNIFDFTSVAAGSQVILFQRNSRSNTLFNNTFIYKNDVQAVHIGTVADPAGNDQRHVKVKNNIFYHYGNTTGSMIALADGNGSSPVTTGIEFDYNNYIDPDWPGIVSWFGTSYDSIAALQVAKGQEMHRVEGDPKFVGASDFHLQPASPAIDAGTNVGLVTDYAGNSIPQGLAPDIGAYEFVYDVPAPRPHPPERLLILY